MKEEILKLALTELKLLIPRYKRMKLLMKPPMKQLKELPMRQAKIQK
jgi:hypothetical protein